MDNPIADALGELLAGALLLGGYAGLVALYRAQPVAAAIVMALLTISFALGLFSLSRRREVQAPTVPERLLRGWALFLLLLFICGLGIVLPVLAADFLFSWVF